MRESEQRVDGQSSIDAADLERLEKFMIRAALGAMSAVMKMLNLIAFPLLLCIEDAYSIKAYFWRRMRCFT